MSPVFFGGGEQFVQGVKTMMPATNANKTSRTTALIPMKKYQHEADNRSKGLWQAGKKGLREG